MKSYVLVLVLPLALFLPAASLPDEKPARLPNIVVILADDLGYGDPGCYNKDSLIATPNIDKLAAQGMRFTDAHSPSSVCTPTRYGLMTGRYCWRTPLNKGVLYGYAPLLIERGRMTIPSLLQLFRYITACIGKWHLGLGDEKETDYGKPLTPGPNSVGFDYFFGIPASLDMTPYVYVENQRVVEAPTGKIEGKGGKTFWRAGPIAPGFKHEEVHDRLTAKAVEFIKKQSAEKPFFLYFPLTSPHIPWLPGKKFEGKSKAGPYGDFVMHVDDTVGQVLKALDDAKLAESTLVIFTADNGAFWTPEDIAQWKHRANGQLHGQKGDIWEGGHRVPFIARWPGKVVAGSTSREVICHTDLLATFAAIVGAKLPEDAGEDSFSFLPVLLGKKIEKPIREATVLHSVNGTFAIRQGPWRLANALGSQGFSKPMNIKPQPGGPRGELYNLEQNPEEKTNLWEKEPEVVRRLTGLLEKYQAEGRSRKR